MNSLWGSSRGGHIPLVQDKFSATRQGNREFCLLFLYAHLRSVGDLERSCETIRGDLIAILGDIPVGIAELDHVSRLFPLLVLHPVVGEFETRHGDAIFEEDRLYLLHPQSLKRLLVEVELNLPDDPVRTFKVAGVNVRVPIKAAVQEDLVTRNQAREDAFHQDRSLLGLGDRRGGRKGREFARLLRRRYRVGTSPLQGGRLLVDNRFRRSATRNPEEATSGEGKSQRRQGAMNLRGKFVLSRDENSPFHVWFLSRADDQRAGSVSVIRTQNWGGST